MECVNLSLKNTICCVFTLICLLLSGCVTKIVDENGKEINNKVNQAQVEEAQKAIVIRYLNNSMPNKAFTELKTLFKLYGEDNVSLNNLMGLTQLALNSYDKALMYFTKSYEKEANPATGLNISSTYLAKGDNKKAISLLKDLIKKFPDYTYFERYYHNIGVAYESMGESNKAKDYYQKALEENPNNYPSALNMAKLYQKEGDSEEALRYFQRSSDLCSLCFEPLKQVSDYYVSKKNYQKASSVLKDYLEKQDISFDDRKEAIRCLKEVKQNLKVEDKTDQAKNQSKNLVTKPTKTNNQKLVKTKQPKQPKQPKPIKNKEYALKLQNTPNSNFSSKSSSKSTLKSNKNTGSKSLKKYKSSGANSNLKIN